MCDPQLPTHIRTDVGRGHSGQTETWCVCVGGERDSQKRGAQDRYVYGVGGDSWDGWIARLSLARQMDRGGRAHRRGMFMTDRWTPTGQERDRRTEVRAMTGKEGMGNTQGPS